MTDATIEPLQEKINRLNLPSDLREKLEQMLLRVSRSQETGRFNEEYERLTHYLSWIEKIPWHEHAPEQLNLDEAKKVLDKHHHGLAQIKERILEYLAVLQLNQQANQSAQSQRNQTRAPIILLVGLVGTGKTTLAYSIAEATGRPCVRIPFGGMGSARDLRGQSRMHLESEPGHVVKSLTRAKVMNPIMLLDEIDRVAEDARTDIMGVLVELLDPEQNHEFIDHYIDYPVDLSQVLFIATANNTRHIATAVMDRMEPLSMPSYSDEQKIEIGKNYLLPKALNASGLPKGIITIDENLWPKIVRPLGYDAGIRTLERTIKGMVRKIAKQYVQGNKDPVTVNQENHKQYLPTFETEII